MKKNGSESQKSTFFGVNSRYECCQGVVGD